LKQRFVEEAYQEQFDRTESRFKKKFERLKKRFSPPEFRRINHRFQRRVSFRRRKSEKGREKWRVSAACVRQCPVTHLGSGCD
jgi:hypothetical protein